MQAEAPTTTAPFIPDNAPFSDAQRAWLNGFLAGMFSEAPSTGGAAATTPITILWGSQTGTSEMLARKTAKCLKKKGFAPKIMDLSDFDGSELGKEKLALIITSTYGDGEAPDNAKAFHDYLHSENANELSGVNYAVLALGDSNYEKFCKAGIEIDERMKVLGAHRLVDRVECNIDYEDAFDGWLNVLNEALQPFKSDSGDDVSTEDEDEEDPEFDKKHPYRAKVTACEKLNTNDSSKDVRHVTIDLGESSLKYEAGDAVGIYPINCEELVDEIIAHTHLDGSQTVSHGGTNMSLKEALTAKFDINKISRPLIAAYQHHAQSTELAELLEDSRSEELKKYVVNHHFIDLLETFPCNFESGDRLLKVLPMLQPRLYSISSSPKPNPKWVSITVGTVRYHMNGRARKGVASTFLAERLPADGAVEVFFHHNKTFRLPVDDSLPVIMVGPGTGIAPFRAFLQEREARGAEGQNWLFFGDQHSQSDFLYAEQIRDWQQSGLLNRLSTAFSRDQKEKIYVQHRMIEEATSLYKWLEQGGYFYVCGDASRMAKDVDDALHKAISIASGMNEEAATAYVENLKKEKRYLRDVY